MTFALKQQFLQFKQFGGGGGGGISIIKEKYCYTNKYLFISMRRIVLILVMDPYG